jgi:hypothetical protein
MKVSPGLDYVFFQFFYRHGAHCAVFCSFFFLLFLYPRDAKRRDTAELIRRNGIPGVTKTIKTPYEDADHVAPSEMLNDDVSKIVVPPRVFVDCLPHFQRTLEEVSLDIRLPTLHPNSQTVPPPNEEYVPIIDIRSHCDGQSGGKCPCCYNIEAG